LPRGTNTFRWAVESRDPETLTAALDPEVTFHSPLTDVPIQGRDRVLALFAVLAGVFEDFEYIDELAGERSVALVFRLRVDGQHIEGVDHLRLAEEGRVRSIAVSMRPLPATQALATRISEPLEQLLGGQTDHPLGTPGLR
jgi:hypothetical protein